MLIVAQIFANGTKLKECGSNICGLAKKYEGLINGLFNKLEKLNTYAWSGQSANDYVRSIKLEKKQYQELAKNIYAYGSELYNIGESINSTIERLN